MVYCIVAGSSGYGSTYAYLYCMNRILSLTARTLLGCSLLLAIACGGSPSPNAAKPNSRERVIAAKTIRAAWAQYPPLSVKDLKTGEMSGLMVDVLNEAGKRLNIEVKWTEEVGWGVIFEGLEANRYDIFGAGVWRSASRGRAGDFTRPVFYNVIKLWGSANETRFRALSEVNDPSVRISTNDGAVEDLIAKSDFPLARRVSIPQSSPWTDVLLNITTRKADVTFAEPGAVNLFLEKNPGTLKELLPDTPVRYFGTSFAIKHGESEFKSMLESALEEMSNDGTIDKIIRKYEKHPGEMFRIARPFDLLSAK